MAKPTYQAGTFGNVFAPTSVPFGKQVAALVDLSTALGGAIHCKVTTGGTAPTAGTTFSAFRVVAATAAGNTTLSAGASAGATSLSVASATGIAAGQKVAVLSAAAPHVGELVTVQSASGTTLTVGATQNAYLSGDLVFLVEQAALGAIAPGSAWVANTSYSGSLYPPSAWVWVLQAANGDSAQAVTASATLDTNPSFS